MAWWKPYEEEYLVAHSRDGVQAIADNLGRSVSSVKSQAHRMGISLAVRHLCPNCGRETFKPLSNETGWCRRCTVMASADKAALANRKLREEVKREEEAIREEVRRRQMCYSDSSRRREELRRLREGRNRNATKEGEQG